MADWIPDSSAPSCMEKNCTVVFSFFNRRHHCRKCGRVVCAKCSPQKLQILSTEQPVRVCLSCAVLLGRAGELKHFKITPQQDGHFQVKVILVGEMMTGKTSLVEMFGKNRFFEYPYQETIGAAFRTKAVECFGERCKWEIWDTGGHPRFRSLLPMYYRGAKAAIVCYDITSRTSFETAQTTIADLQRAASPDIVFALIGNKADLHDKRVVSSEQGAQLAQNSGIRTFVETSAKTGQNVQKTFELLLEECLVGPTDWPTFENNFLRLLSRSPPAAIQQLVPPPLFRLIVEYVGKTQLVMWGMHNAG